MTTVKDLIESRPDFSKMVPSNRSEAIKLNDFIYMSQGTSNSYMVLTDEGRVIINTGLGFEAVNHKKIFDAVCPGPTTHILITQGHVDHVGGVSQFRDKDTQLITQQDNEVCQQDDDRIQTVRVMQSGIWFQHVFDYAIEVALKHPDVFIQDHPVPDTTFKDSCIFETGGLQFEIYGVPGGETTDSCVIWLPQHKTLPRRGKI